MTTVADLINDTRRHLYGTFRPERNRLVSGISTSDTTITLEFDLYGLVRGSYIAIDDEILYVISTTPSAKTAVVQRAELGTAAATHLAAAIVDVNPRFPRPFIKDALLDELRSWPNSIFRVATAELAATSTTSGYNLAIPTDYLTVMEVRYQPTGVGSLGDDKTWPRIRHFETVRNADTDAFAAGQALFVQEHLPTSANLFIVYSRPLALSVWNDTTNLEVDVGLQDSMVDIPPYGAAWRLMSGREVKRTFTEDQPEPRHAEEAPPGFSLQVTRDLKRIRDERLAEEAYKLMHRYPVRMG